MKKIPQIVVDESGEGVCFGCEEYLSISRRLKKARREITRLKRRMEEIDSRNLGEIIDALRQVRQEQLSQSVERGKEFNYVRNALNTIFADKK